MRLHRIINEHRKTGAKFLIVGLLNTLSGLAVIFVAKWALGANDVIANISGYAVGITLGFKLNATWTFGQKGYVPSALYKYCFVLFVAYLLNLSTVMLLINTTAIESYYAQALGIVPYTLFTYVCSRYLVFNEARET